MTVYQCARGVHGLGWLVSTARCLALSWGVGQDLPEALWPLYLGADGDVSRGTPAWGFSV